MKLISFLKILFLVFINISLCQGQYIKGKILDEDSSNPIGNTEISINDQLFFSDPSGKFQIENIFPNMEYIHNYYIHKYLNFNKLAIGMIFRRVQVSINLKYFYNEISFLLFNRTTTFRLQFFLCI